MKTNNMSIDLTRLLGGLSVDEFLHEYWQKKPLLIRSAIPDFSGVLTANELAGLACEEGMQSRLIEYKRKRWHVTHGPLDEAVFDGLSERDWTLLVQGVNHALPEAAALLQAFAFIPYARLDDLMVSYAPDGGGVGPHFDSYDVFLLQGMGQREWRISQQTELAILDDAPLRILKKFNTEATYLLNPGDMLYLPPKVAHWGIARGECMTYSIGFRAPSAQELGTQFLGFIQERLTLSGLYEDPDLQRQQAPAYLSSAMVDQVARMIAQIQWNKSDVATFLGSYLSEPKPHIVFESPRRRLGRASFQDECFKRGVQLSLTSLMLFDEQHVYLNGEVLAAPAAHQTLLQLLANQRSLSSEHLLSWSQQTDATAMEWMMAQLYTWYQAGYLGPVKAS